MRLRRRLRRRWRLRVRLGRKMAAEDDDDEEGSRCAAARRLKTIAVVIRSTREAEELLQLYEEQLKSAHAVPADLPELEGCCQELKVPWGGCGAAVGRL